MNRKIKIIIVALSLIVLGFVFNPFYWLMGSKAIQQPELSIKEIAYFEKFTKRNKVTIERYYENFTIDGRDTLYKDYNDKEFDYVMTIHTSTGKSPIKLESDSIFSIANYIKTYILNNNKNLRNIIIYDDLKKIKFNNRNSTLNKVN